MLPAWNALSGQEARNLEKPLRCAGAAPAANIRGAESHTSMKSAISAITCSHKASWPYFTW